MSPSRQVLKRNRRTFQIATPTLSFRRHNDFQAPGALLLRQKSRWSLEQFWRRGKRGRGNLQINRTTHFRRQAERLCTCARRISDHCISYCAKRKYISGNSHQTVCTTIKHSIGIGRSSEATSQERPKRISAGIVGEIRLPKDKQLLNLKWGLLSAFLAIARRVVCEKTKPHG